jgi:glycolate oxidase iron-sulfur subunit
MAGPRGRIDLMRAATGGRIGLDGALRIHLDACLTCRSCEAACPSGVRYGELVDTVREAIAEARRRGPAERALRAVLLRHLVPFPRRIRRLELLLALYQRSGLAAIVSRLLPSGLRNLHALLPPLPVGLRCLPAVAPALGPRRGTVAFFRGCLQDAFLHLVNEATLRVLQRNGFEVHTPDAQTCCAALALHMGEAELGRALARRNIDAIDPDRYDAIVSNAGGCGVALKDYGRLLAGDAARADRAARFASKTVDFSEFLASRHLAAPLGAVPTRAVYVDSCHLRHVQRGARAPRELLGAVPSLELVELAHPPWCCGSAGTYNISHPDTAGRILATKLDDIAATGARTIVTSNTGCHFQLLAGVRTRGLDCDVVHVAEVLDRAHVAAAPEAGL